MKFLVVLVCFCFMLACARKVRNKEPGVYLQQGDIEVMFERFKKGPIVADKNGEELFEVPIEYHSLHHLSGDNPGDFNYVYPKELSDPELLEDIATLASGFDPSTFKDGTEYEGKSYTYTCARKEKNGRSRIQCGPIRGKNLAVFDRKDMMMLSDIGRLYRKKATVDVASRAFKDMESRNAIGELEKILTPEAIEALRNPKKKSAFLQSIEDSVPIDPTLPQEGKTPQAKDNKPRTFTVSLDKDGMHGLPPDIKLRSNVRNADEKRSPEGPMLRPTKAKKEQTEL